MAGGTTIGHTELIWISQHDFTNTRELHTTTELQFVSETKTAFLAGENRDQVRRAIAQGLRTDLCRFSHSVPTLPYGMITTTEHSPKFRESSPHTQYNESAKSDVIVFEALNRSFEFHQGQANRFSTERDALWMQRNALHIAFVKPRYRDETTRRTSGDGGNSS